MRKGGADNEASSDQSVVCRAGGCGRDIYRNNEEIKKGVQVNHPAAPARGSWAGHYCRHERSLAINGQHQQQGMGIGWIILLVILFIILLPVLGPIDDLAASALGVYHALKRL